MQKRSMHSKTMVCCLSPLNCVQEPIFSLTIPGSVIMITIVGMGIHRTRVEIVVSPIWDDAPIHSTRSLALVARPCPDGKFKCASGHCVSNTSRCDGFPQCNDASDEAGCPPRYPNGQYCPVDRFTCNNTICINQHWVCDGGRSPISLS